jgi:hypothetical protein
MAAIGRYMVAPEVSPRVLLNVILAEVGKESIYGGFSPCTRPSPQPQPHVSATFESEGHRWGHGCGDVDHARAIGVVRGVDLALSIVHL